jgi:hypothetical protein
MDILSGADAVEAFQKAFTEAHGVEVSEWTPDEFRNQTRLNSHQSAFAERFSQGAPTAWDDLLFLQPLAEEYLSHHLRGEEIGQGDNRTALEAVQAANLLHFGIRTWMEKYGISASWVHAVAFTTLRACALSQSSSSDPPSTLLHNTFPTLVIDGDNIELGQSSFTATPWSAVVVCPDLGPQVWDTLTESQSTFKQRLIDAYTQELNDQLSRVDNPTLAEDLKVKLHWIDMTIDRYAGRMSTKATATKHGRSRPGVDKAVEAVRSVLGFEELPPDWGATSPKRWRLHAT